MMEITYLHIYRVVVPHQLRHKKGQALTTTQSHHHHHHNVGWVHHNTIEARNIWCLNPLRLIVDLPIPSIYKDGHLKYLLVVH